MKNLFSNYNLLLIAATLLLGLGIYYFIFEQEKNDIWMTLLMGAILNLFLANKEKSRKNRQ